MSRGWAGGSTPAWRRLRLRVLVRDRYECQLQSPGCTREAVEVHHVLGVGTSGIECDPVHLQSACRSCNRRLGAPQVDPPHRIATQW